MSYNLIDRLAEELVEEVSLSRAQIESVLSALVKRGALNASVHDATEFPLVDESDGITKMTFEEYLALPIERRHSLALELQKRNWRSIQSELIRRNAQWMLVCGGAVIEYSSNWKELPTDEKIKEIGHQQNKVPLVFVRNPLIEETAWSPLPDDDWYPTLPVYFGQAQWDDEQLVQHGLFIISDFDTGALGNVKSAPMQCRCVMNWASSPICHINPQRQALVGRNLLLTFALQVNLNGATRSTRLPASD